MKCVYVSEKYTLCQQQKSYLARAWRAPDPKNIFDTDSIATRTPTALLHFAR